MNKDGILFDSVITKKIFRREVLENFLKNQKNLEVIDILEIIYGMSVMIFQLIKFENIQEIM